MKKIFIHFMLSSLILSACGNAPISLPQGTPEVTITSQYTGSEKPSSGVENISQETATPLVISIRPSPTDTTMLLPVTTPGDIPGVNPNQITQTPEEIYQTEEFKIYGWTSIGENWAQYGVVDPNKGWAEDLSSVHPPITTALLTPHQSNTVAFSNFTQKVAYLTNIEKFELWIANLNLEKIEKIWEEPKEKWLLIEPYDSARIFWGPSDNSIFVISGEKILVYSLKSKAAMQWMGSCTTLAQGQNTHQLGVWCQINIDGKLVYGVVESDGSLSIQSTLPPKAITNVMDWAFSASGEQVAYATANNLVLVDAIHNTQTEIPIIYQPLGYLSYRRGLQFSYDEKLLLVYGSDLNKSLCPPFYNDLTELYQSRPCWMVINSKSGEVVWWPTDIIPNTIGFSWDVVVGSSFDAAISPDGKWLAMFYSAGGHESGVITSLITGKTIEFLGKVVSLINWGK